MSNWVAVHGLVDGNTSPVNADTLNRPLFELAERTNYLYNQLQQLVGQNQYDSIRLPSAPLDTSTIGAPAVGDAVYLDPVTQVFTKAAATMAILDEFIAAESAYAVGILITKDGVVIDGHHRIKAAIKLGIDIPAVIIDSSVVTINPSQIIIRDKIPFVILYYRRIK